MVGVVCISGSGGVAGPLLTRVYFSGYVFLLEM